jgi:hypothetical protein
MTLKLPKLQIGEIYEEWFDDVPTSGKYVYRVLEIIDDDYYGWNPDVLIIYRVELLINTTDDGELGEIDWEVYDTDYIRLAPKYYKSPLWRVLNEKG